MVDKSYWTMKAIVQYNDYVGTTAADRSDFWCDHLGEMTGIIIKEFDIPLEEEGFQYLGVSVNGTEVEDVCASFFFKNKETLEVVKYFKASVKLQSILNLFKRFEFQIGDHLEDIDDDMVVSIE